MPHSIGAFAGRLAQFASERMAPVNSRQADTRAIFVDHGMGIFDDLDQILVRSIGLRADPLADLLKNIAPETCVA